MLFIFDQWIKHLTHSRISLLVYSVMVCGFVNDYSICNILQKHICVACVKTNSCENQMWTTCVVVICKGGMCSQTRTYAQQCLERNMDMTHVRNIWRVCTAYVFQILFVAYELASFTNRPNCDILWKACLEKHASVSYVRHM